MALRDTRRARKIVFIKILNALCAILGALSGFTRLIAALPHWDLGNCLGFRKLVLRIFFQ